MLSKRAIPAGAAFNGAALYQVYGLQDRSILSWLYHVIFLAFHSRVTTDRNDRARLRLCQACHSIFGRVINTSIST